MFAVEKKNHLTEIQDVMYGHMKWNPSFKEIMLQYTTHHRASALTDDFTHDQSAGF